MTSQELMNIALSRKHGRPGRDNNPGQNAVIETRGSKRYARLTEAMAAVIRRKA